MADPDAELAASCNAGHLPALEEIYRLYAACIWRYARYYSGSEDAAEEIVQESFLRVARYLPAFEGRSKLSTWLYTIVRSVAIDITTRLRKAPKSMEGEELEQAAMRRELSGGMGPLEESIGKETRAAVRDAVARLPENEREAVVLCELQELSLRQAGEVLGWTESRVKVTLFRGRRRLRALLSAYVGAEV